MYGVIAYGVAQRTREMGLRVALGALPGDVVRLVVRDGMLLTAGGIGAGLVAAIGARAGAAARCSSPCSRATRRPSRRWRAR